MKVKVLIPVFGEAASKLVNTANKHQEAILLKKGHWVIDAKSILGVLAISLQPGQEIELVLKGSNSDALQEILELGIFEKL